MAEPLFVLGEGQKKPELVKDPLPFILEEKEWNNFINEILYEVDCLFVEWFEKISETEDWQKHYKHRKFSPGMLYHLMFGHKCDESNAIERKYRYWLAAIMKHHAVRRQRLSTIKGVTYKHVYTLPRKLKRKPLSLKLRLEMIAAEGLTVSREDMRLEDPLPQGTARHPLTQKRIEARRAKMKEVYNKRYKDREH
jgi:hypothetical protein